MDRMSCSLVQTETFLRKILASGVHFMIDVEDVCVLGGGSYDSVL